MNRISRLNSKGRWLADPHNLKELKNVPECLKSITGWSRDLMKDNVLYKEKNSWGIRSPRLQLRFCHLLSTLGKPPNSLESIPSFKKAPDTIPICFQTLLRGSTEINIFKSKPHMTRLIEDILLRGYLCMDSHIREPKSYKSN